MYHTLLIPLFIEAVVKTVKGCIDRLQELFVHQCFCHGHENLNVLKIIKNVCFGGLIIPDFGLPFRIGMFHIKYVKVKLCEMN